MKTKNIQSLLKKRDMNACIAELLKIYGAYIRAKVIRAVSNETEREELMEEIIVHLYQKLSNNVYTEEGKFDYWLRTVVNNFIVSWIRIKAKRITISDVRLEQIPSVSPSVSESIHREKLYTLLWKAIFLLEDSQRDMLLLHFEKGIRLTEIAKMQGISYNAFYKKFKKTLLLLEQLCKKQGFTDDEYYWLKSRK